MYLLLVHKYLNSIHNLWCVTTVSLKLRVKRSHTYYNHVMATRHLPQSYTLNCIFRDETEKPRLSREYTRQHKREKELWTLWLELDLAHSLISVCLFFFNFTDEKSEIQEVKWFNSKPSTSHDNCVTNNTLLSTCLIY